MDTHHKFEMGRNTRLLLSTSSVLDLNRNQFLTTFFAIDLNIMQIHAC